MKNMVRKILTLGIILLLIVSIPIAMSPIVWAEDSDAKNQMVPSCSQDIMIQNERVSNVSTPVPPSEEVLTTLGSQDGCSPDPFVRRTYGPLKTELVKGPSHNSSVVYVVVNSTLWSSGGVALQNRISRYHDDIEAKGFSVSTWTLWSGSPEGIRSWLQAHATGLAGCVLIGNIPSAWWQVFPMSAWASYDEFPSDLFYMDLDGAWFDTRVPPASGTVGWTEGTDGIYDIHNATTGDVWPEIWIGRIKADNMALPEVGLITNYFDKNHAYRTGGLTLPRRALVYIDIYTPGTEFYNAVKLAYPDSTLVNDEGTTKRTDYLDRLDDQWSWVFESAHGAPDGLYFMVPDATGKQVFEMPYVSWNDIRTGDYPVFFYYLQSCHAAKFTEPNYFAGWCIFAPTYGLAAIGATSFGSAFFMDPLKNFFGPLYENISLGEALMTWFSLAGEFSFPYGVTLIGDPTLTLQYPKHQMTINTPGLDGATGVVHYMEDRVSKTGDIVSGSWSGFCDHGTTLAIDNEVTISPDERYFTTDTSTWGKIHEPGTFTVNYYHQHKPTIATSGLPASAIATVSYVQNGVTKTKTGIWDGNSFSDWCDAGSTVSITNLVIVSSGERYYSTDTTSWIVSSAFSATVFYRHQFIVTCSVTTAGTGHEDLTAINHVTVDYQQSGSAMSKDIYDGHDLSDWMDDGSACTFENPSSGSTSTRRWYTPSLTSYTVASSTTRSLIYYEQFLMEVSSIGGLLTSTYKGTTNYMKFATSQTGHYWDVSPWSDWCDIGSTLTASQVVLGPPNERYHTPGTVSWVVTKSESYELPHHKEYKVTVKAEGLPDTLSTTVTIGTADPSSSDDVAGGDINDYVLTLDSSSVPPFTWTNWVHTDTDMTALSLITASASEKYTLVYWTRDGLRLGPPTVYAGVAGLTYSAQYVGAKKDMSLDEAELSNPITVTIEISNPPAGTTEDKAYVVEDLPNELSFVKGSAKVDGTAYTPDVTHETSPKLHERLTFEVDGSGKHTITFEVKVNRAYAASTVVENRVSITFDLVDVGEVPVDVLFDVTVHPYIGPTLSKATDGPTIVPLFTEESWVFTYIVKNNYDYEMAGPLLKDNFGAELVYDPNTVIANLLTEWEFPTKNGRSEKISLFWDLPNLAAGEAYMLQVTMSTGKTPSVPAQQEYTSPGVKILNSGATLKWFDDADKMQSLETGTISVTAIRQK